MVQRTGGWGVPVFVPMHDVDGKPGAEGERRKAVGYRRTARGDNGEGEWEYTREYSTRIVGIMRVYFFILSMSASVFVPAGASQVQAGRALKLFQLPHFWSYFSCILGDKRLLETAVAAQMLHAALDVAGFEACQIWGKQWIKLLEVLYQSCIFGVDSKTAVGTSPPGTKAGGNGNKEAQKVLCLLGGRTAEGKSARVRVQLEIERIIKAL